MINNIKKYIINNKNKRIQIKINYIRNKSEYIDGIIVEIYDRFFIVKSHDNIKRSFNFSDLLTGYIEIIK